MYRIVYKHDLFNAFLVGIALILFLPLESNGQDPLFELNDEVDSLKSAEGEFVRKFYVLPIISVSPETSFRLGATTTNPMYIDIHVRIYRKIPKCFSKLWKTLKMSYVISNIY